MAIAELEAVGPLLADAFGLDSVQVRNPDKQAARLNAQAAKSRARRSQEYRAARDEYAAVLDRILAVLDEQLLIGIERKAPGQEPEREVAPAPEPMRA